MRWIGAVLLGMALVGSLPSLAKANPSRFALFAASNRAPAGLPRLRYAHNDAEKMRDAFVELGGVAPENAILLLDPDGEELRKALADLRARARKNDGDQLIFYYSGHANESALLLGGSEELPFAAVHEFLKDESAQVRLALVDSCRSGALTQVKGGKLEPGIDIRWTFEQPVQGAVLITSSAAEEASVERDDIGGSLFTHFFVSGIRGAADSDEDGRVSLEEAFDYAYNHTLARSTESRSGTQHPTYEYRISGQQQLVVSWLDLPSSIGFGEDLIGTYVVFDRTRNQVVAELSKEPGARRQLRLTPGDYYVKKRMPSAVLLQKVGLAKGAEHEVKDHEMHTVPYEEDVTKGLRSEVFRSTWKYGAPFTVNTAHTYRRDELSIGLWAAAVGLTDDVTVGTSVLGDLLLTPNLFIKLRLAQSSSLVWSLETGFGQSYWGRIADGAERSETDLKAGTTLSWLATDFLTVSLLTHWTFQSRPDVEATEWESQMIRVGGSLTWLLGEHDLIQLHGEGIITVVPPGNPGAVGDMDWGGTLMYAHAWNVFRIGVGVIRNVSYEELDVTSGLAPYLDLWWRW